MNSPSVAKLYHSVIDEVIESMREAVLEEGIDDQVLAELKQLWEQKLKASKALESAPSHLPLPAATSTRKQPAASVGASTSAQPAAPAAMGPTQIYRPSPVRAQQTQPLDMSGAAATATMALPPMYQQHLLAGSIQLQQTSSGGLTAVIPASVIQAGNLTLQPQQVQMQPQNLSTKVQGQLDGADDEPSQSLAENIDAVEGACSAPQSEQEPCVQHKAKLRRKRKTREIEVIIQLDGGDSSSDDDDVDDDDEDEEGAEAEGEGEIEEEPLNSEDDDTDGDEEPNLFEMDNVVVCQYDKITRAKNRWRFTLKDGIMNINGRDYVFQKAHGEAEW